MNRFQDSILRRTLPVSLFEELCSLWQQLVEMEAETAVLITQETISLEISSEVENLAPEQFYLLLSPQFSALLQGIQDTSDLSYQVRITWDPPAIASFINQLREQLPETSPWRDRLLPLSSTQTFPPTPLKTFFTHRLWDILVPESLMNLEVSCKPVEDALYQQIAQERLLNQVIGQIRQSLDLSVILETAVRELRSFLQVDRLVIYEFGDGTSAYPSNPQVPKSWGSVTYEERVSNSIPSMLNVRAEDNCFSQIPQYQKKYRQGNIVAVEDVENTYSASFCLIQFLEQYWIHSKLIAPIVVEENLWGLLIAHQCFRKRQWSENEKSFLGKIGEHLAIAIYQAQLYAQVQEQKKTFEQRVIARTQELRDTLLASQSANHSKSEFLSNMSHELRTPLTCVIGLSGTLLHWSGENSSLPLEKQRQYLQTIQESGKHLLEVINEILEFSKLQAGKYVLEIRDFSLDYIAKRALQELAEEAKRRRINLELELQINEEEDVFFADPERVQQILYHLLNNALKFTPEKGTVILRIWKEGNEAIFQVEDTGIGIKQEQMPLLFESFQQLENSRQRTYGGTGLGLALTKQLVELHGGTIEVESIVGEGSLFTIRLPNQTQRILKSSGTLETNQPDLKKNRSIVLVESNEEIATLIGELLTAAKYQFIWLIDSVTAFKQIELLQPTAVILDQDLIQAYQISERLKKSQKTKWIKVLLLSHKISAEDWNEISQRGIDDYCLKPIRPNHLLKRVNALISRENNLENNMS